MDAGHHKGGKSMFAGKEGRRRWLPERKGVEGGQRTILAARVEQSGEGGGFLRKEA